MKSLDLSIETDWSKKESGISIWCIFSAYFFHKDVPYLILYHLTKFQYQNYFSSKDIKQYVFKFLLNQLKESWTSRFPFNHLFEQWLTGGKRGKKEIHKIEYLEKEKGFLDEIKSTTHNFLRAIIWTKKRKIAGFKFDDAKNKVITKFSQGF